MRVVLEGRSLARTRNFGGVDSYWRQLILHLLTAAPAEHRFVLLSAFLNPGRAKALQSYQDQGAVIRHFWSAPQWIDRLGRAGARAEWFAGRHDIVHAVEPVWHLRGKARLVVTAHDLMYHHHPQFLDPRWVRRLSEGTEAMVKRASFWICVSAHTREELVRSFGVPRARTAVVYHGVDPAFGAIRDDVDTQREVLQRLDVHERPYFLFLGSVEPKKNLGVLLESFGRALENGVAADLVVAGRAGWQSDTVRAAVDAAPQLKERVRFLGFVDQPDLPSLVTGARALVLPSRWEGFGMPVLEAMAAGTPVLTSDRGSLPEVSGGAARHFDPDDVDALAEWLQRVDEDEALRTAMRDAGLEHAAAFTWQRCANETLAAYAQAMAQPA